MRSEICNSERSEDFVNHHSVVRRIWGDPDLVLLIFAGSAAEFALNRAVDWLFFTGKIPSDPIGRFFSTVEFAQSIVFADEEAAQATFSQINAVHSSVEDRRGLRIPDWAYRDVLYMLIDYSERAQGLVYRPLVASEQNELYETFRRVGEGLHISMLPTTYAEWQHDRRRHLRRDLVYSDYTALLYQQYRRDLGLLRYYILLQLQALLAPEEVRLLLELKSHPIISQLVRAYSMLDQLKLQFLIRRVLIPPRHWPQIQKLYRAAKA
ncbi:MAG: oxygenase MpaB family protein [Candidatus Binatia bacterium]